MHVDVRRNKQTNRRAGVVLARKEAPEVENKAGWFSCNQPYNSFAKYL
jgi:hypothetical protein